MAKRDGEVLQSQLAAISDIIDQNPVGIKLSELEQKLQTTIALTRGEIQYRLGILVKTGRISLQGKRRWATYYPVTGLPVGIELSKESIALLAYINLPITARDPAAFDPSVIEAFDPSKPNLLSDSEKEHLENIGSGHEAEAPAGTYARRIMDRLLIDLSWNSSRLEGNTYSLLDTRRLIRFGAEAEGGEATEAQMIHNHRDAIEFLIEGAGDNKYDRRTIQNLHAILSNNLLPDPMSSGRIRTIEVGITGSTFLPLDVPQKLENYLDLILKKISRISNPFEQSLATLLFIPYLQPFDDVNKRVSRLAANIPFIERNLTPISFVEVETNLYTSALLGFYERCDSSLLKDLFLWGYSRSVRQYAAVQQQMGAPDPFRLKYRDQLFKIVSSLVKNKIVGREIVITIKDFAQSYIQAGDREQFREVAEIEIQSLHGGNYARYRITPREFEAWMEIMS